MIKLENVDLSLGGNKIISSFSHYFEEGSITALTGASGCGKTTLLRIIAGLETPDSGKVIREGKISYAFQEPRLLSDMTALENINFVLGGKRETLAKAEKWLTLAELDSDRGKYPSELSGGMKQRVSLVRALAYESQILLLDEPFAALDGALKGRMIELVREYSVGRTTVFVTHDDMEAELLADFTLKLDK